MAESHTHNNDPYAFLLELSRISMSQEKLLNHTPFVGEDTLNSQETEDDVPQDVFHTPPEESSPPSSEDLGRNSELGVSGCTRGKRQFDDWGVLKRGLSDLGEPSVNKSKLSEPSLGFDSDKLVEGNRSVEASGMRQAQGLRVLPPSLRGRLENAASGKGQGREENQIPVFNALKLFSKNSREDDDILDSLTLFQVAKRRGITFPRPRWWPDGDNFNPQE
ncbi:uncharacterized protein LOC113870867 [Abrus precatorius]|uniref:Uncharacterized protein LOC113870867 n=1 Tax=Abrus precatorius TaxID=3816 RepID=A0A8B8M7Y6_ABRPR|nr:uncharacterized protein LOC113870867 [Abrus precatorius]